MKKSVVVFLLVGALQGKLKMAVQLNDLDLGDLS